MRFYLVKDKQVKFKDWHLSSYLIDHHGMPQFPPWPPQNPSCQLIHYPDFLIPMMSEKTNDEGKYWDMNTVEKCGEILMAAIKEDLDAAAEFAANISISSNLRVPLDQLKISVKIADYLLFKTLHNICGDGMKIIVELYFTMWHVSMAGIITPEMKIFEYKIKDKKLLAYCAEAKDIPATKFFAEFWSKNAHGFALQAKCSIILIVDDNLPLFHTSPKIDTNRQILESGVASDFEIVARDGSAFKCHKNFLLVHSSVLQAMIGVGMTEANTNRMKMKDMSRNGVVAFLRYLYCQDLPRGNLDIIFECLQAGHKYDIAHMEQDMMKLLVNTDDVYFTAEFANRVLSFVQNIPGGEVLRDKVGKIAEIENQDDTEMVEV